ncbi:excalibur calcium-binding domain-containing protein [Nocardioides yefusunii]|uniref:Excalibur calcium-binding domain-containing protein n=1 Tax=Nocardioides yefusunii TaxID=2500546 RepID=A0ABW1QU18_9ACTN|nr:excalibur calcium-binding domain-containing protein [Nocardioides yefusunii]
MKRISIALATAALTVAPLALTTTTAEAAAPKKPAMYKNCTALNKVYPHGVGRAKAVDKTSGKRVTNFKRSTKAYKKAMSHNKGLDRDKDGIACEKR